MTLEDEVDQVVRPAEWSFKEQSRVAFDGILYWLGTMIVNAYARRMFKPDVVFHAPLPAGGKLLAVNHPSTTDPFLALLLTAEQTTILIDDRLFKVPVFGAYLRRMGHVPVIPGKGQSAVEAAQGLLKAGRTVAIFPEGAISPLGGGFHKPRTGAARLALSTGVAVIPVGVYLDRSHIRLFKTSIEGTPAVGTWYICGPYAVTVGKPLYFEGNVENRTYVREVSECIMQRIIELSHESARRMEAARTFAAPPVLWRLAAALGLTCPHEPEWLLPLEVEEDEGQATTDGLGDGVYCYRMLAGPGYTGNA